MKLGKISLINLGCSKNIVDSEIMLGILSNAGYKIVLDEEEADLIIVNTCAFIHDAEQESVRAILEQVENDKKVIIVGCLSQKHGKELQEAIPEASAIIGTSEIENILEVVNAVLENSEESYYRVSEKIDYLQTDTVSRYHITMGATSYIKIAEGCDWHCTYCIIPKLKGNYRSRTIESIVNEAKKLVDDGVTELILIAQDTSNYGIDLYNKLALPDLLIELEKIEELKWVRLMYTYPKTITDELIEVMASSKKVVHYLDMPLQHAHPDVLKRMNRPDVDVERIIEKLRTKIPDICLRTTFIVGFPGETEEQFEYLANFIEKYQFERLGVFEYSQVEGTPSALYKDQISDDVKEKRRNAIMEMQQEISTKKNNELVGKVMDVLLEEIEEDGSATGRTYMDAPEIDGLVHLDSSCGYLPGEIIPVKITSVTAYDLYGVVER